MSIFKEFKDEPIVENNEASDEVVVAVEVENDVMIDEPVMEQDELDESVDAELLDAVFENTEEVVEQPKQSRPELKQEDKNAVTVITKGTTINGSIISDNCCSFFSHKF